MRRRTSIGYTHTLQVNGEMKMKTLKKGANEEFINLAQRELSFGLKPRKYSQIEFFSFSAEKS